MNEKLKVVLMEIEKISELICKDVIQIMEVCGTHTHVIYESGIKHLLPKKIKLISGPGCPICVTEKSFIDNALVMGTQGATIITFGDMARVRGSSSSLMEERKNGVDLRIIYSLDNILSICREDPIKKYVFLGIGFETTAPIIANMIKTVYEKDIENLYFYNSIKIMAPILRKIMASSSYIDGFILPGNVAVIQGEDEFKLLFSKSKVPGVIAGFTFEDVLISIYTILVDIYKQQLKKDKREVTNIYKPYVRPHGNIKAKELMAEIFHIESGKWRGIGLVEDSTLVIKEKYKKLDAQEVFKLKSGDEHHNSTNFQCKCSEIIMGKLNPEDCILFKTLCTIEKPQGPCMVSIEGTCYCAYKFITL